MKIVSIIYFSISASIAYSVEIPITNHSFESPAVSPGNFNVSAPPPGWSSFGSLHPSGVRSVGVVNPNSTQLYLDPVPLGTNIGVVFLGLTHSNIPTGLFQALSTTLQARTAYTLLPGEGRFLTSTVYAVTSSSHTNLGLPLGIRLINLDSAPGIEVNFDDVRIDAVAIPDPEVTISSSDLSEVQVAFTENLQSSPDLLAWTNVVPLPVSPWTITPEESILFYRATE